MERNATDELIWVDMFDNEIGSGEKLETHVKEQLHRAFSVFIVHEGKMFLQRRALDKYHSGGLWANACCSHPRKGETLEVAVQRRMEEELGIVRGSCTPKEVLAFTYYSRYDGLSEYEYDHVFLCDYAGKMTPDPLEMMDYRWVDLKELEQEVVNEPQKFSAWFIIAISRVLAEIKKCQDKEA